MGGISDPFGSRSRGWVSNSEFYPPVKVSCVSNDRFQQPIIAIQNTLPPSEISVGMSILMFTQTLSGAAFLTFADVIFSTGLKTLIPKDAPNVNPEVIIAAGATGIRNVVLSENLPGVLKAYADSVDRVFYMSAGLGVVCMVFAFGMGWKDVRKKKPTGQV